MAFKLKIWHVIAIALVVAVYMGWISIPYFQGGGGAPLPPGTTPPSGTITHPAAQLQLQVVDFITSGGITTATTTVDFSQASSGVFNLLTQADTMTHASNPDTYNVFYADGAELIIHADCTGNPTNGLDYYDGWYYVVVHEGNPIYYLKPSMLQIVTTQPYTYRVTLAGAQQTGSVVTWTSGTTNYWDLGKLFLFPRTAAAGLNLYLTYSGTTLSSVTDGSTWLSTSSTANATLAGTSEHLSFLTTFDNANLGWGWSDYGVTTQGEVVEYAPFLVMSTNMSAIDTAQLQAEGWKPINDNTLYAEKAFYKQIGPFYTSKGSIASPPAIQVPVYDAAAASGGYIFRFWILDMQREANVQIGSTTTTIPTAYGMMTSYGPGAMVQATAYSTSSGKGSGSAIVCWATKS